MKTVLKALAQVQADIAKQGISKSQENTYDKYKFRGIDDVLNALARLCASLSKGRQTRIAKAMKLTGRSLKSRRKRSLRDLKAPAVTLRSFFPF